MPDLTSSDTAGDADDMTAAWAAVQPEDESFYFFTTGNCAEREEFISGLRALADYLAGQPHVPVSRYGCQVEVFTSGTDQEKFAQVDLAGKILGQAVTDETMTGGHYKAMRSFGPVTYTVVAIPASRSAEHKALMSYHGSVVPDEPREPARLAAAGFPARETPATRLPAPETTGPRGADPAARTAVRRTA